MIDEPLLHWECVAMAQEFGTISQSYPDSSETFFETQFCQVINFFQYEAPIVPSITTSLPFPASTSIWLLLFQKKE
jgi:hypothetical protein